VKHRSLVLAVLTLIACAWTGMALHAAPGEDGLLTDFVWRSIGPGSAGGRIVDVESLDADPRFVLVGTAGGGVWKSVNGGTTFVPLYDRYATGSIGDVAVNQKDPRIIWVGTVRAPTATTSGGATRLKSTDGGATFATSG
jgi:hypothetical protein